MRAIFVCAMLAVGAAGGSAVAAPPKAPCKSCTLDVPAKADKPTPLLVLLHGDRQAATTLAGWWRKAALARGWAVLSLQCPRDLKCDDSYWKWDGEPQWVFDQVAAVPNIDPARVYLVGWSGGASWIGYRAQAWSHVFAALVIHGGGISPRDADCTTIPVYFLVGDANPLHQLAVQLRAYFDGCKADVTWDLVAHADHAGEEQALAKKQSGILDWLAAHARESGKQGTGSGAGAP